MQDFFAGLSAVTGVLLIVIGLIAGWIAGRIAGRNKALYMVIGVIGALVTPFILAAVGATVLAAGGIVAILFAALVGAAILLVLGKLVFDR
ncbi:MAG: GlsB/YeaQ/YmgE family stress response membrane protein [Roseivivax sp.]|nr:GlsB/YeaQ/YmgE family stress response membrane protein [Roseivivax sp.]